MLENGLMYSYQHIQCNVIMPPQNTNLELIKHLLQIKSICTFQWDSHWRIFIFFPFLACHSMIASSKHGQEHNT